MKKYIIIVAGGQGVRMGSDIPKQFHLLKGKPLLIHTIEAFYYYDSGIEIILVLPENRIDYWKGLCLKYRVEIPHRITAGGATRFHSVQNALQLVEVEEDSIVGVHDGARPLVTKDVIERAYQAVEIGKAVCPVIPVVDSLRIKTNKGTRRISRDLYYQVQTPQVFMAKALLNAYLKPYSPEFTDDISVVETSGKCQTIVVDGSPDNIKITTSIDLVIAEALLSSR
jgi:2-C-methyl-D-erythritol 4-phosphate cytidylyltransferase